MRWKVLLVAIVLFLLVLGGDEVVSTFTNGGRVGPQTDVDENGLVPVPPEELAAQAGVDLEVYALARCLASEHANDPNIYLLSIGWAVKNKAAERQESILELLTNGAGDAGDGWFGEQKAAAGTKYASTARDPHVRHVEVATSVIFGGMPDPTGGATHFFSPRAQDALAQKAADGDERYRKYAGKDAEYIFRSWAQPGGLYPQGAVPVVPAGIDPRTLTLWRRA